MKTIKWSKINFGSLKEPDENALITIENHNSLLGLVILGA
jgi:hypothetical protein